jgi:hypothetical protein
MAQVISRFRFGFGVSRLCSGMRLDHAVEGFPRLDHAELAARAFFDSGLAGLQVLDFSREGIVALLQARILGALLGDRALQGFRARPVAVAQPELALQREQDHQQSDNRPPWRARFPLQRLRLTNASRPA